MNPRSSQAGFTLVEVLVGFILVGFLMSMLFGGLRFGTRVLAEVEARSDGLENIQPVRSFLRKSLSIEATLPPFIGWPDPEHGVIVGTSSRVTWRALPPTPFAFKGLTDLTASHDAADGSVELHWRPATLNGLEALPEWTGRRQLLQGVRSLSISYFDPVGGWRPAWEEPTRDPAAIRIDIRFVDPDRSWQPLVIALPQ